MGARQCHQHPRKRSAHWLPIAAHSNGQLGCRHSRIPVFHHAQRSLERQADPSISQRRNAQNRLAIQNKTLVFTHHKTKIPFIANLHCRVADRGNQPELAIMGVSCDWNHRRRTSLPGDTFRDIRRLILPINQLVLIIRTAMVDVRQFLSTDAHALSQHSNDVVNRTAQQATCLGQTAAAIKQINSTVHQTSGMTKTGAEFTQSSMAAELAQIVDGLEDNAQVSADNIKIFKLATHDKTHAHANAVGLQHIHKVQNEDASTLLPILQAIGSA